MNNFKLIFRRLNICILTPLIYFALGMPVAFGRELSLSLPGIQANDIISVSQGKCDPSAIPWNDSTIAIQPEGRPMRITYALGSWKQKYNYRIGDLTYSFNVTTQNQQTIDEIRSNPNKRVTECLITRKFRVADINEQGPPCTPAANSENIQ